MFAHSDGEEEDLDQDLSEAPQDPDEGTEVRLWSELKIRQMDMNIPDIYAATDGGVKQFKCGLWRIWRNIEVASGVLDIKLSPNRRLFTAHKDGSVRSYDLKTGEGALKVEMHFKGTRQTIDRPKVNLKPIQNLIISSK